MNISVPVLVTEHKQTNSSAVSRTVRPLFYPSPVEQGESFQRALNKLAGSLRQMLETAGKEARHDRIAEFTFNPQPSGKIVNFTLNLGAENFHCKYFIATFAAFGRKIAFSPNVPEVWFDLAREENLEIRAITAYTQHFKRLERREGRGSQNPARFNFQGKTWLTTLDFDVYLPQKFERKEENFFAFLGMSGVGSGAEELRKTGRNLDWLYPNDLERVTGRERELEHLTELLASPDRRPILLVGKRLTGKTALVHEFVYQTAAGRKNSRQPEQNTWHLSPQRLVSGMMYVGQWEERLLAIIKEAKEKKHLLYFDDLLGLFLAGQSASSDVSMAQVLKTYVERREIRLLGEITPESLRVLQEKDRSFADLFQIVRIEETDDERTLRIMLAVRRNLEARYNCRFALDVLPTALDLQRRYAKDAAFPGKAAVFLQKLAVKYKDKEISRDAVLREFEAKSGMSVEFLDDKQKLEREEITGKISGGVIGQTAAVEAAADVISIAKARLNDPTRPLAAFLFLGATGVGKTEAAKQIAAYLYGDAEKLLRFDMNEYVSPFDVARLVGSFDQPEGLLTSAIRRQPFSVILLDEIEKAHPDVFNLLLQVLGEGRLTDALGRTADFTNAIIILTSNLGAREANLKLGFRQTNESDAHVFRQAAEKFFKPEFFNRLDRIIPFERLRREDVEQIAGKVLQKVFRRDGFLRRNSKLQVSPEAMRLIVNEGYHPQLGARALKRAVEKYLTAPVAARVAALPPDAPMTIEVSASDGKITARVEEIKPLEIETSVWLMRDFSDVDRELDLIAAALDRVEDEIEPLRPRGEILAHDPKNARYFLIRDQIKKIERMIERAEKWQQKESQISNLKPQTPESRSRSQRQLVSLQDSSLDLGKFLSAPNPAFRLKELAAENRAFGEKLEDYLQDIWRETALLQAFADSKEKSIEKCALVIAVDDSSLSTLIEENANLYEELFSQLELKTERVNLIKAATESGARQILLVSGAGAAALARAETGIHLTYRTQGEFVPVRVGFVELSPEENPEKQISRLRLGQEQAAVVRLYNERSDDFQLVFDFRTGLLTKDALTTREFRTFVLSGLPAPPELA